MKQRIGGVHTLVGNAACDSEQGDGAMYTASSIQVSTWVRGTNGLIVRDSPRAPSLVWQVPGGPGTCVHGRRCRTVTVGHHIAWHV